MIIKNKQGYGYNDLTIVPAEISFIKSRSEVDPFTQDGNLPIFTAPMSSVVNCENFGLWELNGITPILPRNIDFETRIKFLKNYKWVAVSLNEFETIYKWLKDGTLSLDIDETYKICVDIANGNMLKLFQGCSKMSRDFSYFVEIMTGNIANPKSIKYYEEAGINYVRCSIGSGAGCTTASNTSIHYPVASLIEECYCQRSKNSNLKIIADGGIRNYSDVIKALALGADYVMIGGLFSSFLESAAPLTMESIYKTNNKGKFTFVEDECLDYETLLLKEQEKWGDVYEDINPVPYNESNRQYPYFFYDIDIWSPHTHESIKRKFLEVNSDKKITKEFFGMSTKKAQRLIKAKSELKTSEGTTKTFDVKYTMKQWCDNMEAYLRSAMSYCNALTLNKFIGQQELIVNSINENQSVNK